MCPNNVLTENVDRNVLTESFERKSFLETSFGGVGGRGRGEGREGRRGGREGGVNQSCARGRPNAVRYKGLTILGFRVRVSLAGHPRFGFR